MESHLTVHIEGPGVREGKIALDDLRKILAPLQAAVRALLPSRKGVPAAKFLVSAIGPGSATAAVEIDTAEQLELTGFERDPLGRIVAAVADPTAPLPRRARSAVDRIARRLPEGVDVIELRCNSAKAPARITRAAPLPQPPQNKEYRAVEGLLIQVDFDTGTGRLRVQPKPTGRQQIDIRFDDRFADDMQRFARQIVRVYGDAEIKASGAIAALEVLQIELIRDDRPALWAAKRFKWPLPEEAIDDPNLDEFLQLTRDARQDAG